MRIKIENFIIKSSEHGGYNLIEQKKSTDGDDKDSVRENIVSYGITVPLCVKRIIDKTLHNNPITLSLGQYIIEYKTQVDRIEKLLDLEKIK